MPTTLKSDYGTRQNSKPKFAEVVVGDNEVNEMVNNKALASMIKADIRNRFLVPYASIYCQQFDNFKNVADFFEFAVKLMRKYQILNINGH